MGMKSIWNNDYYNKQPLPKWSFELIFDSFIHPNKHNKNYANTLNKSIVSCQWGKREISIVKTYYAGIEANFPGRVQNTGELTLTFNENSDMYVSKVLDEIFNGECSDDAFFTGKGKSYFYNHEFNKVDRTLTLRILKPDENMEIGENFVSAGEVEFHNCILTSIQEEEFSYESTDDIVTRTARISYDYMVDKRKKLGAYFIKDR